MPWREMSLINQRRAFVRLAAQDAGRIGGPQISARLQTAEPVRAPQPSGCRTTSDDKLGLSRASDCEFSDCFDKSRFSIAHRQKAVVATPPEQQGVRHQIDARRDSARRENSEERG